MSKKFIYIGPNAENLEANSFEQGDFISSSAGSADAGKPVVLDANGLLDGSMVNASAIDHGSLSGLGDDDHSIYILADGSRPFGGVATYQTIPTLNDDKQLVHKKYVDDLKRDYTWYESALDQVNDPPVSPSAGDRYLVDTAPTGDFIGHANEIAEYDGSAWIFTTPVSGGKILLLDDATAEYRFDGSAWIRQSFEATTASTGLTKVGLDIQIDPGAAGDGLAFSSGILSVNPDNSSIEVVSDQVKVKALGITNDMLAGSIDDSKLLEDYIKTSEVDDVTIEFASGSLNVKDAGINALKIDFGLNSNQVSASDIPIADGGNFTNESNVEGSLQELYGLIGERGVELTSDGVSKGDLLYVSASNTLAKYSTMTTYKKAVGLAHATVAQGSPVKSLANDTRLNGVLSGATPGDVYYWDGSSHVNSIPTTAGFYVIQTGTAINATDLYVEVRPVKKNFI